jgi:hypothetical protein
MMLPFFYPTRLTMVFNNFALYYKVVGQVVFLKALPNNAKMKADAGKYIYKPSFEIRDKKGFLRLLEQHHVKGAGGIFIDDIEESLPHAQKIIEVLSTTCKTPF